MARYASLMASQPVPVYPAVSATDVAAASPFRSVVRQLLRAVRRRRAAPPAWTRPASAAPPPAPGARTHYAFDSAGPEGTVRVIVIDNSAGSLAASNAHQNPLEDQRPWLAGDAARTRRRAASPRS